MRILVEYQGDVSRLILLTQEIARELVWETLDEHWTDPDKVRSLFNHGHCRWLSRDIGHAHRGFDLPDLIAEKKGWCTFFGRDRHALLTDALVTTDARERSRFATQNGVPNSAAFHVVLDDSPVLWRSGLEKGTGRTRSEQAAQNERMNAMPLTVGTTTTTRTGWASMTGPLMSRTLRTRMPPPQRSTAEDEITAFEAAAALREEAARIDDRIAEMPRWTVGPPSPEAMERAMTFVLDMEGNRTPVTTPTGRRRT